MQLTLSALSGKGRIDPQHGQNAGSPLLNALTGKRGTDRDMTHEGGKFKEGGARSLWAEIVARCRKFFL